MKSPTLLVDVLHTVLHFTVCAGTKSDLVQWRTEGGGLGGIKLPPNPRNSEGPPKSCQTQPDCENC